jgi:hypothetical protein
MPHNILQLCNYCKKKNKIWILTVLLEGTSMTSSLVAVQTPPRPTTNVSPRLERLTHELRMALAATDRSDLARWGVDTGNLFVKCGWNRLSRTGNLMKSGIGATVGAAVGAFSAWREDRLMAFLEGQIDSLREAGYSTYIATRESFELLGQQLSNDPAEVGPRILTMVLVSLVVSGGTDADGGAPDLDLVFGIGAHRSFLTHSIIMGTVLETGIFSLIRLVQVVHAKLPQQHDPFWDQALRQAENILNAARTGASLGMAYHLLGDGLVQPAPYKDLIVALPIEGHQSLLVINSLAELANAASLVPSASGVAGATAYRPEQVLPAQQATADGPKVGEPAAIWPHNRQFVDHSEARAFLKHVQTKCDKKAEILVGHKQFVVKYHSHIRTPSGGYRTRRQIGSDEARFIRANYLLWVPIADIAVAVDRTEGSVHAWLCELGLRETVLPPSERLGSLSYETAYYACDQIGCGWLSSEYTDILRANGVLPMTEGGSPAPARLDLASLSTHEMGRLAEFAAQNKRYDVASLLVSELGDYRRGFLLALQGNHLTLGMQALEKIATAEPILVRVRESTLHYLRQEVIDGLPKFMTQWDAAEQARCLGKVLSDDKSKALQSEGKQLLEKLKAAMGLPNADWAKRIIRLEHKFEQSLSAIPTQEEEARAHAQKLSASLRELVQQLKSVWMRYQNIQIIKRVVAYSHVLSAIEENAGIAQIDSETFRRLLIETLPVNTAKAARIEDARWAAITRQVSFVNSKV